MFDGAWRSSGPVQDDVPARDGDLARSDGAAELVFAGGEGRARLRHLFQSTPCRIAFPRAPLDDLPLAVLLTTTGGLTGGDRMRLSLAAEAGARAVVTSQAAEKIYRSLGADAVVDIVVRVDAGGWLEWLPQETILFDGARLRRRTRIEIAGDARVLAGEILVFGRTAHGERFERGFLHDGWRVFRDDRLVWADALRLAGDARGSAGSLLDAPAGLGGARASAMIVHAAPDAAGRLDAAREIQDAGLASLPGLRGGATAFNNLLILRWLGDDAYAVRQAFGRFWRAFRASAAGLPPVLPKLWDV
jgi:urease accessory protein